MARFNDRTRMTPDAFRCYAAALRTLADMHEFVANAMKTAQIPAVDPTHGKSAIDGITRMNKFLAASINAYCDAVGEIGVAGMAGGVAELRRLSGRMEAAPEEATKAAAQFQEAEKIVDSRERRREKKKAKTP